MRQKRNVTFFRVMIFIYCLSARSFHVISQARPLHFDLYTPSNGLAGTEIKCMMQDSKGYLWMGGLEGLTRFDGNVFETFRKSTQTSHSLQSNLISCLAEDKTHLLWIGYQDEGLTSYDVSKKIFTNYHAGNMEGDLPPGKITFIFIDRDNIVWLGVEKKGILRFDRSTEKFFTYPLPDISPSYSPETQRVYNNVYSVHEDDNGLFWLATHNGLYTFNKTKALFTPVREKPVNPKAFREDLFGIIIPDKNNTLWMGSWGGGISSYNKRNKTWQNYKYNNIDINKATTNIIRDLCLKTDSELWVATSDSGFGVFNIHTKRFHFYNQYNTGHTSGLPATVCEKLLTDNNGDTWISHFGGLSRLRNQGTQFIFNPLPVARSDNGAYYFVTDFYEDQAKHLLYMSTSFAEGLYMKNLITGKITNYPLPVKPSNQEGFQLILDLVPDSNNNLWVLTKDHLLKFDLAKQEYIFPVQPFFEKDFTGSPSFSKLFRDHAGNIWITSERKGAIMFNTITQTFTWFRSSGKLSGKEICSNSIQSIAEDAEHHIWLGSYGKGVSVYNPSTGGFVHYTHQKNDTGSINSNRVLSMSSDKNGNVWLGFFDGGLCKAMRDTNGKMFFRKYHYKDGLSSDNVYQVYCDSEGMIWCATSLSLSKLNPANDEIISFDSRNNLQTTFSFYNISETKSCRLLAGYAGGYYDLSPRIISDTMGAEIQIKSFRVFDNEFPLQYDSANHYSVSLSYLQNFFTCDFTVINFINPEKNRFAVQLEEFENQVTQNGNRRFASYTNLQPGNYILHITASNGNGTWNNEGVRIHITITPPFWKTNWFLFLTIIILAGSLIFIYNWRLKKIRIEERKKTEINKRIAEIKLTALQSQMNPHFVFNSLNSIQQIIHSGDKNEALDYLSKFSKLIRQMLNQSSKNMVTLAEEMETLHLYLEMETLRFANAFDYVIASDPSIRQHETEIPPMLVQPFAENAIIHGLLNKKQKGQLKILFEKKKRCIECIVEDNGIGREASLQLKNGKIKSHESMGIKMTGERLETFSFVSGQKAAYRIVDLRDSNNNSTGTRVIITMPVTEKQ